MVIVENSISSNALDLIKASKLYRTYQAEHEEILRHKWIESEKAGYDIGFEWALTDWIIKHQRKWCKEREKQSLLKTIEQKGINILVFSDIEEFRYKRDLSAAEYQSRQKLIEIAGMYESPSPGTFRKADVLLTSPILGGVFSNEYRDGDQSYHIHFHKSFKLTVSKDKEENLKIVDIIKE
ncbi:MAG: hypothetical protein AABW75_01340 [Nanoarchaeota archaeon]